MLQPVMAGYSCPVMETTTEFCYGQLLRLLSAQQELIHPLAARELQPQDAPHHHSGCQILEQRELLLALLLRKNSILCQGIYCSASKHYPSHRHAAYFLGGWGIYRA